MSERNGAGAPGPAGPHNPTGPAGGGFRQMAWGFILTGIDFRLGGFDLLPDVVGHLLFMAGLGGLTGANMRLRQASRYNIPMCFLSLLSLWQRTPADSYISYGLFGPLGTLIGLAALAIKLAMVANLLLGIGELAADGGFPEIAAEAGQRWWQYLMLSLAGQFGIVAAGLPGIGGIVIIAIWVAYVALAVTLSGFMNRCGETIGRPPAP